MKSSAISLDRSRQVAVQIHEILKERILAVQLVPGTLLVRGALQEEFGVSQTPVRDALLRLQDEGLVDIFPQHATLVSRIDVGLARQAQFLRLSLELESLRRLASETPVQTAEALERLLVRQERMADPATYDEFDALDRDFHRVFYERSGNLGLWQMMRTRSTHLDRLRRLNLPMPGKMQNVLRDHHAIVEGIRSGNRDGCAEAALRHHLSGTLSMVDEISARYPEYVLSDAPRDRGPIAASARV